MTPPKIEKNWGSKFYNFFKFQLVEEKNGFSQFFGNFYKSNTFQNNYM